MENIVAQMLTATGRKLHFFSSSNRNDTKLNMEIDFLIANTKLGRKKNIVPIEVKSGKKYTTTSLDKFIAKYGPYLDQPYILHTKDLEVRNGVRALSLRARHVRPGRGRDPRIREIQGAIAEGAT